jgi:hypothetical protein
MVTPEQLRALDLPAQPDEGGCHPTAIAFGLTVMGISCSPEIVNDVMGRPPDSAPDYRGVAEMELWLMDQGLKVENVWPLRYQKPISEGDKREAKEAYDVTEERYAQHGRAGRFRESTVWRIGAGVLRKRLAATEDGIIFAAAYSLNPHETHGVIVFGLEDRQTYFFNPGYPKSSLHKVSIDAAVSWFIPGRPLTVIKR